MHNIQKNIIPQVFEALAGCDGHWKHDSLDDDWDLEGIWSDARP